MKVKYIGPFDAVEIPDLGAVVEHDKELEVELPDVAVGLLEQAANFEPADEEATALLARIEADRKRAEEDEQAEDQVVDDGLGTLTIKQLEEQARVEPGGPVDITGLTKKDDLIAAIRTHRENEGA